MAVEEFTGALDNAAEWASRSDAFRAAQPAMMQDRLGILQSELDTVTDPADRAALLREISRTQVRLQSGDYFGTGKATPVAKTTPVKLASVEEFNGELDPPKKGKNIGEKIVDLLIPSAQAAEVGGVEEFNGKLDGEAMPTPAGAVQEFTGQLDAAPTAAPAADKPFDFKETLKNTLGFGVGALDIVGGVPAGVAGTGAGIGSAVLNWDATKGLSTAQEVMHALTPSTLAAKLPGDNGAVGRLVGTEGYGIAMKPMDLASRAIAAIGGFGGDVANIAAGGTLPNQNKDIQKQADAITQLSVLGGLTFGGVRGAKGKPAAPQEAPFFPANEGLKVEPRPAFEAAPAPEPLSVGAEAVPVPRGPVAEAVLQAAKEEQSKPIKATQAEGEVLPSADSKAGNPATKDLYSGEMLPDDPLVANLKPELHSALSKAGIDLFTEKPELYTPGASVADNLAAAVKRGDIGQDVLTKYGLNAEELITAFDKSISESAQRMAFHSHVSRAMNLTAEQAEKLKLAGYQVEDSIVAKPLLQRMDGLRKAMMVSQFSTAVGNVVSQMGKVGLDVIQAPLDAAIQKAFGLPQKTMPLDGLQNMMSIATHNKDVINNILTSFPKQNDRLFSMYFGDLQDAAKAKGTSVPLVDQISHVATWANRLQEFTTRRGIFQATLDQELRNRGHDYQKVVKDYGLEQGAFPTYKAYSTDPAFLKDFTESMDTAIAKALEVSFSARPPHGSLAYHLIQANSKMPFLSTAVFPFANYMYNALKFTMEYSPTGILSYLSKSERAAFASGNTSKLSRAILGAAMLGVAIQVVNSDFGGGKFYELTLPGGKRIDLRPYGTMLTPYLFIAHVIKKSKENRLNELTKKDILDGIAGVNFRGGTGLDIADMFLNGFTNQGATKGEKATQAASEFVGSLASQYFTPFQQLRDIYDQFTEEGGMQKIKDTKSGSPLIDPTLSKLPYLSQQLPDLANPIGSKPVVQENPLLKQGLSIRLSQPYNDIEKEMIKYGFTTADVYPNGLTRQLARAYATESGPLIEKVAAQVIHSPKYQESSPAVQALIIESVLNEIKQPVINEVVSKLPIEEQKKYLLDHEPKRLQAVLRERGLMK